ncbi:MAG: NAD(P)/FAD-dependent oxidoreductase [Nanoarchaeota archaeon]
MKRIAIIGAGPAGSQTAYLLSQKGFKVTVFEEHPIIGKPVQCTGIVTSPFQKALGAKDESFVVNKIDTIRIFAPNGNSIDFKFTNADWIVDRTAFDQYLANKAIKAGAEYFTDHHFRGYQKNKNGIILTIKDTKRKKVIEHETDILIGADGPQSTVAKEAGMYGNRKFFFGVQPIVRLENNNIIEVYPAKTGFCWVTPINSHTVKAGIAAEEQANKQLKEFMKKRFGTDYQKKVIETEGGLVPVYNPKQKVQKDNVYLVGDASTAAKATTAGGIIQALIGAQAVTEAISEKKSYQKLWQQRLGKEMHISLFMRRMLNKFKDDDYNNIVAWLKKPNAKKILETSSRDYPSRFIMKIILAEPKLLSYARYLL